MPVFGAFVTRMSGAIELFFEPSYLLRVFGSRQYDSLSKAAFGAVCKRDVAAMAAHDGSLPLHQTVELQRFQPRRCARGQARQRLLRNEVDAI
jgi:hypothetical protein